MKLLFPLLTTLLLTFSLTTRAQYIDLVGKSEEQIRETVTGFETAEDRSLEHEQFDVLVYESKDKVLSFHFQFFQGYKKCYMMKSDEPLERMPELVSYANKHYTSTGHNKWVTPDKKTQLQLLDTGGRVVSVMVLL
jgi:hypothetical protein